MDTMSKVLIAGGVAAGAFVLAKGGTSVELPQPGHTFTPSRERLLANIGFYAKASPQESQESQRLAPAKGYDATIIDAIKQKLKAEFDKLEKEAKIAGCKAMNEQLGTDLDPQACGNATFEAVVAAAAAAGATAACAATGVGGGIAPLCGVAGAFLGKKIAPYLQEALSESKEWLGDKVDDIGNWLSDLW